MFVCESQAGFEGCTRLRLCHTSFAFFVLVAIVSGPRSVGLDAVCTLVVGAAQQPHSEDIVVDRVYAYGAFAVWWISQHMVHLCDQAYMTTNL